MAKTISLKQLAQKQYDLISGLDEKLSACIGIPEDAFDCIIYGPSGNGKSNFTAMLIKALIKAQNCRCEIVAYEEAHGFTLKETLLGRHNMLEELGNAIQITDTYTYDELVNRMGRKKSAKIWIIDSLQAARFTEEQCAALKAKFVTSRKKKMLIYVSWADGKFPKGAAAKSVEYYANIKLRVEGLIVFPKTRYEKDGIGNKPFLIHEEGARKYWGKEFETMLHGRKPKTTKPKKEKPPKAEPPAETVTHLKIAEEEKPAFKEPLKEVI